MSRGPRMAGQNGPHLASRPTRAEGSQTMVCGLKFCLVPMIMMTMVIGRLLSAVSLPGCQDLPCKLQTFTLLLNIQPRNSPQSNNICSRNTALNNTIHYSAVQNNNMRAPRPPSQFQTAPSAVLGEALKNTNNGFQQLANIKFLPNNQQIGGVCSPSPLTSYADTVLLKKEKQNDRSPLLGFFNASLTTELFAAIWFSSSANSANYATWNFHLTHETSPLEISYCRSACS